jgi:predicted metal-dependent peptidase
VKEGMKMQHLDAKDKIVKARITLQKTNPFYSYLALNLNFLEDKEGALSGGTMGVDIKGNVYYNKDYAEKLSDSHMISVICHEINHIVFNHLKRRVDREGLVWNIAADIVTNNILANNGFDLHEDWIVPERNRVSILGIEIRNIDQKIAEQIYDELSKEIDKQPKYSFDNHIMSDGDGGEGKGEGNERQKNAKKQPEISESGKLPDWKRLVSEALAFAKQRGKAPLGMDRYIEDVLFPKQNWKELLYRYITAEIPTDYDYSRPSKKFYATGIYLPRLMKENIDIVAVIDTSGSIDKKDLEDFMAEVVGITKSFSNIHVTLLVCDTKIQAEYEIKNGFNVNDINMKGGGGTDITCIRDWIAENKPYTKLWVYLTDGVTEFNGENPYHAIWVITRKGTTEVAENTENVEIVKM